MRSLNLFLAGVASILAPAASAQFDPHLDPAGKPPMPNFDSRLDADGRARPEVVEVLAARRAGETARARAQALQQLRARVPGVALDDDQFFGTPHFVRSTTAMLTRPAPAGWDAEQIVSAFLAEHRGLFEVGPEALESTRRSRDYLTRHNGAQHLTWKQEIDGLELFGCELRANLTRHGEIINLSSTLLVPPAGGFAVPAAELSDLDAIRIAAFSIGVDLPQDPDPLGGPAGASSRREWIARGGLRTDEPVTSERLVFPRTRDELVPAWKIALPELGIGNTYEIVVDATDGSILWRWNRLHFAFGGTQSISFRVFTTDSPAPGSPGNATPNGGQFPTVLQQMVTVHPAEVISASPNHWIADGGNETLGNNVDAHLDLNADNVADTPRPQGSPARTFGFVVDPALDPSDANYRSGVVTQVFYLSNRFHDRMYGLGFDEAAGNFQNVNLSGQGLGVDRVRADCQDGSGFNNANFSTQGADGTGSRMQMYLFNGPTPDRDGDLESDIVYHELTHGVSIRLLDGAVSGEQAGGMGEGWGDFVGLCLNSEPADPLNAVYPAGGWALNLFLGFTDNYYFGIRRFPYSTDVTKNPQTYADADPNQQFYAPAIPRSTVIPNNADSVHNVGEIWCGALWECRANMIAANGFAANETILQLVIDGMKLSPGTPNFLQARDAILQADLVANGGANLTYLWSGFAKRGMGSSASSPAGTTTTGIVEAFDVPNLILFAYPEGRPDRIAPGVFTPIEVRILGIGASLPTPGSGQFHWSVNGGGTNVAPMTAIGPNHYVANLPALACFDQLAWYVSTGTNTGPRFDPPAAPGTRYTAFVATGDAAVLTDNFQTDTGWTTSVSGATSGQWERGVPVNDGSWAYDPAADGDGSGSAWLTLNQAGNTDVDNGSVLLVSSPLDYSAPNGNIEYDYYLRLTEDNGADWLRVEASSTGTGGPWTTIALHTVDGGSLWRHHVIEASTILAAGVTPTSSLHLRFTATDGNPQSVVEAGLDGLIVTGATCVPPATAYCFGDGTGTACPCANSGASGEGCASSLGNGARLEASGSASVANDTLVLTTTGIPNGPGLYFQGTLKTADGLGTVFGDGLRCASGTTIRIGTVTAAGNSSSIPPPATNPLSVRGQIPPGGATRFYQLWYRNGAAFCTAATFNLSNGMSVSWQP